MFIIYYKQISVLKSAWDKWIITDFISDVCNETIPYNSKLHVTEIRNSIASNYVLIYNIFIWYSSSLQAVSRIGWFMNQHLTVQVLNKHIDWTVMIMTVSLLYCPSAANL